MDYLPESTRLLYTQLLSQCLHGAAPSGRGLSFVSKRIRGGKHWYLQLTVGSRKTQHYLGPDSEDLRTLMAKKKTLSGAGPQGAFHEIPHQGKAAKRGCPDAAARPCHEQTGPSRGARYLRGAGALSRLLLEDSQPAVVVAKAGILVNVPAPARYALHKLVAAERRVPAFQTKTRKDMQQAEQLIEALVRDRPGDLRSAWHAGEEQPGKFVRQMRGGMRKLSKETHAALSAVIARKRR